MKLRTIAVLVLAGIVVLGFAIVAAMRRSTATAQAARPLLVVY
jgi:hypothetical protein